MRAASLEQLVWVLVYGGLLAACLGVFIQRGGAAGGWVLVAGGVVAALCGAALVLVRARMATPTPTQPPQPTSSSSSPAAPAAPAASVERPPFDPSQGLP